MQVDILRYLNKCRFKDRKHYQKIDKYKRKYRENISVRNLPMDFTDDSTPSVYNERIIVGNKIIKTKKNNDVMILPIARHPRADLAIFRSFRLI